MSERLFGTDGIRGIANRYPMSAELALKVGRAVGHLAQREERPHTILIGKDTRRSGYMLENALTAGLCSMGVHVLLVGPLPTPGVSYILRSLRCDGGILQCEGNFVLDAVHHELRLGVLEDKTHMAAHDLRRLAHRVQPENGDAPGERAAGEMGHEAVEAAQQGALARARGPGNQDKLPGGQRQRHAFKRSARRIGVAGGHVGQGNHGFVPAKQAPAPA
ncbi:MAG TPA: hypothetical protein PLM14_08355, partial [Candidatus Hydrogenedentes bacterium]|nr:hypothetical protein [Candidatus Hydrogenedentota bacterium]